MQWNELKPDIVIGNLTGAIRRLDCSSAIRVMLNLVRGSRIYILRDCFEIVTAHVSSDKKEVGGLLLGRVWENNPADLHLTGPLVLLLEAVPSEVCCNSSVSLEMGTEIWDRVNERVSEDLIVVGWYHSHPNLGAFFSETDRRTQRAFFNNAYSVGWVIDPFRNEDKVYIGKDAEEYQPSLLVLNHASLSIERPSLTDRAK